MDKSLKDIPLSGLLSIQQIIEMGSSGIHGFFQKVMKDHEDDKISELYFEELENRLEKKMVLNNEILVRIEKEMFRRVGTVFPKATTHSILPSLNNAHKAELERYKNLYSKKESEKSKPVIDLDTGKK